MVTEVTQYATSCCLHVCPITCWLSHYFLLKSPIIAIFTGCHGNKENEFPWLQRWNFMQQVVIYTYVQLLVDCVIGALNLDPCGSQFTAPGSTWIQSRIHVDPHGSTWIHVNPTLQHQDPPGSTPGSTWIHSRIHVDPNLQYLDPHGSTPGSLWILI